MTTPAATRILTVDDHPILLEGLATVIRSQPDMVLVGQAINCREAIQQVQALQPDVTLMDLRLPDINGLDAITALLAQVPRARVIIMTTFEGDSAIQRALQLGASAYILKNMTPKEIADTIRRVHQGKKQLPTRAAATINDTFGDDKLTQRKGRVLRYVADRDRNREIAYKLFIAEEAVKAHVRQVVQKLGAGDQMPQSPPGCVAA